MQDKEVYSRPEIRLIGLADEVIRTSGESTEDFDVINPDIFEPIGGNN